MSGQHRLIQGDCLAVLPTLPAASVDLVVADLPYGAGTLNAWDTAPDLAALWPPLLRVARPRCTFVFTAGFRFAAALLASMPSLFRYDLVWRKGRATGFLSAKQMPLRNHEMVLVFRRGANVYTPQMWEAGRVRASHGTVADCDRGIDRNTGGRRLAGRIATDRYPLSVLDLPGRDHGALHPTQKPVELLAWLLRTYSAPGATVLDPTSGVASMAVAAARTGRRSVSIERDATYYARGVARLRDELAQQVLPLTAAAPAP